MGFEIGFYKSVLRAGVGSVDWRKGALGKYPFVVSKVRPSVAHRTMYLLGCAG